MEESAEEAHEIVEEVLLESFQIILVVELWVDLAHDLVTVLEVETGCLLEGYFLGYGLQ